MSCDFIHVGSKSYLPFIETAGSGGKNTIPVAYSSPSDSSTWAFRLKRVVSYFGKFYNKCVFYNECGLAYVKIIGCAVTLNLLTTAWEVLCVVNNCSILAP